MAETREKYKETTANLLYKDPNLPPAEMLEVDAAQLRTAKDAELMKAIRLRFTEDGPDRTIDHLTKYPKTASVEGMSAQQTILELRHKIAEQENLDLEEVNLCTPTTHLDDNITLSDCFVDWMGFGLEDWPPRFIVKPRLKGFELNVEVPAMRDTSVWDNGRMQSYLDRILTFDVDKFTTVLELKKLIAKQLAIPSSRHKLTAVMRLNAKCESYYVDLDEDSKSLGDYEVEKYCTAVKFEKSLFDSKGDYIFDDAYWDEKGYHAKPANSWFPQDALSDRSRPDAHKVDPNQPLSIVSDRRQKEAKEQGAS